MMVMAVDKSRYNADSFASTPSISGGKLLMYLFNSIPYQTKWQKSTVMGSNNNHKF
jgi:hypothetical protein